MQSESIDFRDFLRHELVRRCRDNPRYSLRAFSRALGVESAFLSKILSGKRKVTLRTIQRFQGPLGLDPRQADRFRARLAGVAEVTTAEEIPAYEALSLDTFEMIAEWSHLAILELFRTGDCRPDARWFARRLGISAAEATLALERMARLGFVEKTRRGWRETGRNLSSTGYPHSSAALRRLQRKVLEMAITALEDVPLERRDQSTITMAIDSSQVPEAKKLLAALRRKFCHEMQRAPRKDSVYQLSVSFYPVTKPSGGSQ